MAEDQRPEPADETRDEPSLELPSLHLPFRRRRPRPKVPRPTPAPLATTPAAAPQSLMPSPEPSPEPQPESTPEPKRRRERKPVRLHLPGPVAALLTGALVGLALVGLTSAALHLCRSWRGTSSCGKPGILLVLAIAVVAAVLGAVLLRLLRVDKAGSTSLLGVGLLVVLVLLALVTVGDRGAARVVVPLASMLTYLAAWWLTTTYDEPGERTR